MTTIEVGSFSELHEAFATLRANKRWVFRGHTKAEWTLTPKAGRKPYREFDDLRVFECWKRRAVEFVQLTVESDWDWLAIAQHHGLATRLLDWTANPLSAAYFSVCDDSAGDRVIWAASFRKVANPKKNFRQMGEVCRFLPRGVTARITRQAGSFSYHPHPKLALEDQQDSLEGLQKIIVRANYRDTLLRELSYYGINRLSLFPDLDGLSAFLNWSMESGEYWRTPSAIEEFDGF